MPELLQRWVPVVGALLVFGFRLREVYTRRETVKGTVKERATFNLFLLCGVLSVFGGIAEYLFRGLYLWWPTFAAGVVLSVASFVVRRSAIRALGRFWSLHVEMRDGHEFVKTGPFAYSRHPVYFSMVLELLGLALMMNSWITFGAVMVIFIPTMLARVRMEEQALIETFGDAYRAYMKETSAIIPGLKGGAK